MADAKQDLGQEGLPRICIVIADVLPLLILWINFVSGVGFQAIVSQVTMSLVISYFLVFACSLDARINRPELLGISANGFWQPGTPLGITMDVVAMVFLFIVGLVCWSVSRAVAPELLLTSVSLPFAPHPNAAGWNYAPFMVLAVILIGIVFWFISASKYYWPGTKGSSEA